jgi:hypothetical protein
MVMPSTVNTNLPTKGGSTERCALLTDDPLPETLVQRTNLLEQPDTIAVFEVEQLIEAPVQVIRQVCDLPPDLVDGVTS